MMFLGIACGCMGSFGPDADDCLDLDVCVRQLWPDALVAVVDTLRALLLLYLVNAEDDVATLEFETVELRQLFDAVELALEATTTVGREPLRAVLGDNARGDLARDAADVVEPGYLCWGARKAVASYIVGGEYRRGPGLVALLAVTVGAPLGWRPRLHEDGSSKLRIGCEDVTMGTGAFKPMMRFVTLLAVADMGLPKSIDGSSSKGEGSAFSAELFFPKLNFHLDAFLTTTGTGGGITGRGGTAGGSSGSPRCFDDEREALLISRAKD